MDNRNNGYGPLLLFLSQMMNSARQNPSAQPADPAAEDAAERETDVYFAQDETGCAWRKEDRVDLLAEFCREGCAMARKYGHFLLGTGDAGTFLAVPGRFLLAEQPAGGATGFTLWQPLSGGELHYDTLENMTEEAAESVYGYWIGRLDPETLKISEV